MATFREASEMRGWREEVGVQARTVRAPRKRWPFVRQLKRIPALRVALFFFSFFIWERTSLGRERAVSHCQHPLPITPSPPPHDPHPPTPIHTESGAELEKGRQACSRLLGLRASAPRPAASPRDPDGRTHSPEDITCPPRGPADTGNSPQLPGIQTLLGYAVAPSPRPGSPDPRGP